MIRFSIIAATGRNLAIGFQNQLLWNISEDLRRFKEITMGSPIVMGRKTFDSIGRPLPGRANIILTRDSGFFCKNVSVVHSIEESYDKALSFCSRDARKEAFIMVLLSTLPCHFGSKATLIDWEELTQYLLAPEKYEVDTIKTYHSDRLLNLIKL